jgi:hypothetical protein
MTEMPDEDLIERLRAIARQRHEQPLEPYRVPVEKLSEWIAADRIASLRARLKEATALIEKIKLKVIENTDPNWADATSARKSRFDIADMCSAFTHKEGGAR